jgi:hypothetical protein
MLKSAFQGAYGRVAFVELSSEEGKAWVRFYAPAAAAAAAAGATRIPPPVAAELRAVKCSAHFLLSRSHPCKPSGYFSLQISYELTLSLSLFP